VRQEIDLWREADVTEVRPPRKEPKWLWLVFAAFSAWSALITETAWVMWVAIVAGVASMVFFVRALLLTRHPHRFHYF
jgi:hypothetical protein